MYEFVVTLYHVVLEVSNLEAVTPGYDFYFIPTVLNSNDPTWIVGMHQKAMKEFGHLGIHAEELLMEGYPGKPRYVRPQK